MPSHRANRIRELREEAGLSMDELGARCTPKATGSQINKLEKGHTQLTQDWIYRVAAALEIHPLEILEPLPKLSEKEAKVVDLFRGLGEADQEALYRVLGTMVEAGDVKKKA